MPRLTSKSVRLVHASQTLLEKCVFPTTRPLCCIQSAFVCVSLVRPALEYQNQLKMVFIVKKTKTCSSCITLLRGCFRTITHVTGIIISVCGSALPGSVWSPRTGPERTHQARAFKHSEGTAEQLFHCSCCYCGIRFEELKHC